MTSWAGLTSPSFLMTETPLYIQMVHRKYNIVAIIKYYTCMNIDFMYYCWVSQARISLEDKSY